MTTSRDVISKPKRGRFFPLSVAETLAMIKESRFQVHSYHERLPLLFQNCDFECQLGHQLTSFLRLNYLAVFSLPELVAGNLARLSLMYAIDEFARIDRRPDLATRDQQIVIYRAYLGALATVSITQDIVNAGSRSYLLHRKISKITKSQSVAHHETVVARRVIA